MHNPILNKTIIITVIIFSILSVIVIQNLQWPTDNTEKNVIKVTDIKCDAKNHRCKVKLNKLNIEISFDKDVYYLKTFNIFIKTESKDNTNIESVLVNFKMKNMNMGINRFILNKITSENKNTSWKGTALIPVCVTGRADWYSEVEVTTNNYKYIFSIPLSVKQVRN